MASTVHCLIWGPAYFVADALRYLELCSASSLAAETVAMVCWVLACMASWSHWVAMTSDPGVILPTTDPYELGLADPNEEITSFARCKKCSAPKPPSAHHCSECGFCILGMDHHCPWLNNCVGERNMKHFLLFNGYVLSYSLCVGGMLWTVFTAHPDKELQQAAGLVKRCQSIYRGLAPQQAGVLLEAVLFGLFTGTMLFATLNDLMEGMSTIDRLKSSRVFQAKPLKLVLTEVMGSRPSILWLLPTERGRR